MWIRKYLFVLMAIMFIPSFFCLKNYRIQKRRVNHFDEYRRIKVKVDSSRYDISVGIREGNKKEIYYNYNNFSNFVVVDEDEKNNYYKHFQNSKQDSIYIWHNPKAKDFYTVKDSKPLQIEFYKRRMYLNLFFVVITAFLVVWFIYIMFVEKDKITENES